MQSKEKQESTLPLASSVEEARQRAYQVIYEMWPVIVDKFVAEAAAGSVQHAKFLLEWAAIASPAKTSKAAKEEEQRETKPDVSSEMSLAQLVLDTLAAFDRGELNSN
jgi:hypothetical protein